MTRSNPIFSLLFVPSRKSIFCIGLALHAIVFTGIITGCGDAKSTTKPTATPAAAAGSSAASQAVSVRLAEVRPTSVPLTVEAVGTLLGEEESTVSAKVEGRVIKIRADLGDRVADGAVLAQIDPTDFSLIVLQRESALNEALAKLGLTALPEASFDPATVPTVQRAAVQRDNADARLQRSKRLFEQTPPLLSSQDMEDVQTLFVVANRDYDVAVLEARSALATAYARQADVAFSKQQLANTTVLAPGNNSVGEGKSGATSRPARWGVAQRLAAPGDLVRPGTEMYKLVIDDPVKLRAAVPERFADRVRTGLPASVFVEGSSADHTGNVSRVSPVVDPASRTFQIEVTLANPSRTLRPGAFARASVTIGQRNDVVAVPESALQQFAGVDRVFSVGDDAKAKAHTVSIIQTKDGLVYFDKNEIGGASRLVITNVDKLSAGVLTQADQSPETATAITSPAK